MIPKIGEFRNRKGEEEKSKGISQGKKQELPKIGKCTAVKNEVRGYP